MVKARHTKGSAFDKPGPDYNYINDMRLAARASAAASMLDKDATEKAILQKVAGHAQLGVEPRRRFLADVRSALRRVKDGAAATPCKNWSRSCPKCKSGRVGDSHHIFCEMRDTFKHVHEKNLRDELGRDIEEYHLDIWKDSEAGDSADAMPAITCEPCGGSSSSSSWLIPYDDGERAPLVHGPAARVAEGDAAPATEALPPSPGPAPPPPVTAGVVTSSASAAAASSAAITPATATSTIVEADLQARINAGMSKAAAQHAADKWDFECVVGRDASVYRSDIERAATREAAWMRREVSRVMHGVDAAGFPFAPLRTRRVLERDLAPMRTVDGRTISARPNVYDHVTDGASVICVNLATEKAQSICRQAGIGSLPCASPSCFGTNGQWATKPVGWQHQNAAPSVFVDENGRACAMDIARSQCQTCQLAFYHTDPVVLGRLQKVPKLLNSLPFNPQWQFSDIYLHRTHSSNAEYDSITRQGSTNTVEKVRKLGAEACLRVEKQYYDAGQTWWQQMEEMVGECWEGLSLESKLARAALRGEYVYFSQQQDQLTRVAAYNSTEHFGTVMISDNIFTERLLEVYEERRDAREQQMCAVGCQIAAQLDWCAHTGKVLGGKWQALLCNEDSMLAGSKVTQTTKLSEIAEWIKTIKKSRQNFNPKVLVVDNVPPQCLDANGRISTVVVNMLVDCFGLASRDHVIQDKFHVAHSFSPYFCNQDPRFWDLVIRGWRHAVSYREGEAFDTVKSALRAGKVRKQCKFRSVTHRIKLGGTWDDAKIEEAVASGLFDEMFTLCDKPVVPLHIKSAAALRNDVPAWVETIVEAAFAPADAAGKREPIKVNGKVLIATEEKLRHLGQNALKRILNCVPPDDVRDLAWTKTGDLDHNGFEVYKSNFHSCAAESWNSTQPDFVVGSNVTKEAATALHYEGNVRQLMRKQVKLKREEDLGTYNPFDAWEVNRLAGHDTEGPLKRLVSHRPHAVSRPLPVGAGEICVQAIDSFAKRSSGGKRPSLTAEDRLRLPSVKPTVVAAQPQQQQLCWNRATSKQAVAATPLAIAARPAASLPVASLAVRATPLTIAAASIPTLTPAAAITSVATAALCHAAVSHAAAISASSKRAGEQQPSSQAAEPQPSCSAAAAPPQPCAYSAPSVPPKRQKTRAEANSRACKWECMCKPAEQQRVGQRGGGRFACLAECPVERWRRDPGWPQTPTVPDEPAVGTRCSYLPSSGRSGTIEYHGRKVWQPVDA